MLAPHMLINSYSSLVPIQPVSIKTVLKLSVCILSSAGVPVETWTCRAVKVLEIVSSPHVTYPHPALQPVTSPCQIGPVHK